MRFWWVNHKQTFGHEVGKGYIWCPKRKKDELRNHFLCGLAGASIPISGTFLITIAKIFS
jgi:hypothetical protein